VNLGEWNVMLTTEAKLQELKSWVLQHGLENRVHIGTIEDLLLWRKSPRHSAFNEVEGLPVASPAASPSETKGYFDYFRNLKARFASCLRPKTKKDPDTDSACALEV